MTSDPTIRTTVSAATVATDATVISDRKSAVSPTGSRPAGPFPDVVIERELGRGGMGVVYLGRQTYLDRPVAVKVLLLDQASRGGDYVKRFQREARILAGLSHPHIVACHSAGVTADGNPYLVMEYIDGPDLRKWINANGPLSERDAVRLIRDLALGLEHAHAQGIIHRDVKPENVLLAKAPAGTFPFIAKLVDLGLARPAVAQGEHALTVEGQVLGTPATMAPEQFEHPEAVDHRADIYGLGCVLYHALAGQPAFSAPTIAAIVHDKVAGAIPDPAGARPGISKPVSSLARRLLARDPADRPQTYRDLVERCSAILDGSASNRRPPWLFAAVAGGIVLGLAAIALAYAPRHASANPSPTVTTPPGTPTTVPVVSASTAPTVSPTAPPAASAGPEDLLGFGQSDRLRGWTISPGGRWIAAEEREHAITGLSGWISRPVGPAPWTLSAVLHLTNRADAKTDVVNIGLIQSDGSTLSLTVKNLGETWLAAIETAPMPGDKPTTLKGPASLPPTVDLPIELRVAADSLTVLVGKDILGPIPQRIAPKAVLAAVVNATTSGGACDISRIILTR